MGISDKNRWPSTAFVDFFCLTKKSCYLILMGPRKPCRDIVMNQLSEDFGSLDLMISEYNISVPLTIKIITYLQC